MILLDTDTLSIQQYAASEFATAVDRHIAQLPPAEEIATTIIFYEEQTRGWFAFLAKARTRSEKLRAYGHLANHLVRWKQINVVPFGEAEMACFEQLLSQRLRIGKSDLKIAAIALANDATLVSRNLADFSKIPGLRVEDWTRP